MKTRSRIVMAALVAGLVLGISGGAALAANINNLSGQSCAGEGSWHFVNNQTRGAAAGTLYARWSSGETCYVGADKVLSSTQHFNCTASGTLLSASTDLPGKLVLSDFSCGDVCKPTGNEICKNGLDDNCDGQIDETPCDEIKP